MCSDLIQIAWFICPCAVSMMVAIGRVNLIKRPDEDSGVGLEIAPWRARDPL